MFFVRTFNVIIKLLKRKKLQKIKKYSGWKGKKVIKKQEAKELLSMVDKISLLGPLLI